ncbi:Sugar transporter SWEET1 [Trichinella pseudospiralis]|uniref:Sugar transporter SWEET1 n=2 Tax=Trichinella pseudospiralis TaxID=6337 RepID=A0A0V1JB62_TRIPS|nr:Sugar transporter SWEET1 [Trichinella pseudospiralis]KRZ32216.1 Sugar transporter SWEET1 [Trichinella pseudospiralis]KRZ38970.1 Sugar transporter SWEET1 [Trichinella pseudospiralis]
MPCHQQSCRRKNTLADFCCRLLDVSEIAVNSYYSVKQSFTLAGECGQMLPSCSMLMWHAAAAIPVSVLTSGIMSQQYPDMCNVTDERFECFAFFKNAINFIQSSVELLCNEITINKQPVQYILLFEFVFFLVQQHRFHLICFCLSNEQFKFALLLHKHLSCGLAQLTNVGQFQHTTSMELQFLDLLSISATFSTIGMFLVGIPMCKSIIRKKSSEGVSPVPFAMCAVSCFFWLQYGILKHDRTIVLINLVGFILQVLYYMVLYSHSKQKSFIHLIMLAAILSCSALQYYLMKSTNHNTTLNNLGKMCLVLNVLNFASPLAVLKEVIKSKSCESLPLPLCAANLIVAAQWFLYGLLVSDPYIKIPNMIGIALAVFQLSLFFIFPKERAHHG